MKTGVYPGRGRDLTRLRAVGSTGSPSHPRASTGSRQLGERTWLFSMSGGTEVYTAFLGGVPTEPVYAGELQGRALGASVYAFDAAGRPCSTEPSASSSSPTHAVHAARTSGTTRPSPPPRHLLRPLPGRLAPRRLGHDHAPRAAVIHGRSDATINRAGVRIGTAGVYRALLRVPALSDALAVDLPTQHGESRSCSSLSCPTVNIDPGAHDEIKRRLRDRLFTPARPRLSSRRPAYRARCPGNPRATHQSDSSAANHVETLANRDALAEPRLPRLLRRARSGRLAGVER